MKFEEVLPALREGKKIKRKSMPCGYFHINEKNHVVYGKGNFYSVGLETNILQDDWEIVEEKKKVKLRDLTEEQLKRWQWLICSSDKCNGCPFSKLLGNKKDGCIYNVYYCIKDKSVFSDKFLDQEIEIEVDD